MPQRASATQQAPANFAPLIAGVAVTAAVVATFFQLPGAVIAAAGIAIASFFFNAPPQANAKEPQPDKVQQAHRRWQDLRWRTIVPSGDWLLNSPADIPAFRSAGREGSEKLSAKLPAPIRSIVGLAGEVIGLLSWFVLPGRFVSMVAVGAGLAVLSVPANLVAISEWIPAEAVGYDLAWLNAIYAYGTVMAVDAAIRRTAAIADPSPGVPVSALTSKAKGGDGGAWRAFIGFGFLGALIAAGTLLVILSLNAAYLFVPPWLLGVGFGLVVAGGSLHGVARNDALEPWRDKVQARAQWVPRWEAMKYPEVTMIDHERVGSFTVDTFDAPPSLGSAKAINLYNTVVPYLAGGGEVSVAMLTVPAVDSQGQPVPGSAHATRFRVVVAPADAEVQTLNPAVDIEELKLAAEVGAFHDAREVNAQVPILLELSAAHTPDSKAAVWQTSWTVPLASAATVAWSLGVDPDNGIFSEGRATFFGDFENATLADRTLPSRMEKAAYEARWGRRWADALKMGEKPPHLQYGAIKRERLNPSTEVVYEPFLVSQGLSPTQFFQKDMRTRIVTTMKAAPFLTTIGITGALAGGLGPGIRHGQGFAVVHSDSPIPANPAEIASPGPRARDVAKWVMGGLINRAFEDAKLPYPEVITAEALTRPQSKGHVWKVHLRLYDGVTTSTLKLSATKLSQSLGGVRWLRFEESEYGCYLVMGAQPHAEGVRFANPQALAYCDKLDWAQAFQDSGVRSATDASTPLMLENAPHENNPSITRMVFSMPQGFNLGKVLEATDKLRSATANDYVDIRAGETPDKFVVLAAETDPIPFPAFPDWDLIADDEGKAHTRLPFAQTTDGSVVKFDWSVDPHLNVLGQSGGGKSVLLQILASGAILHGCDVYLMDPIKGGSDFEFARPYMRAMVGQGEYLGAGELMQLIGAESEVRKKLNVRYGVGNYKDLPAEVRPRHVFVIIDEFQSLLKSKAPLAKQPESDDESDIAIWEAQRQINQGVGKIAMHIGKLAREARSVGITIILAGQAMKAADLERVGLGGLKTNFSRIALGKMSYGDLASAFKDPATLPKLGETVPNGRGIFESTGGSALIVQNWWEKQGPDEMARQIAMRVPPLDPSLQIDVAALAQRVLDATPKAFGALVEDEFQVEDEDETITLNADDLGIDLGDLSFDADFSFDEPTPAPADEEVFTLEEPPTDLPLPQAAAPEEPKPQPRPEPLLGERPLFHEGQFVPMPTMLEGRIAIGTDIVFGVNAPTGDGFEAGWPEGDALRLLLAANPGITEVVWVDDMLDELDEIGIPREDIARDIAAGFGVSLVTELVSAPPVREPAAEPAPVAAPTIDPTTLASDEPGALFSMGDFEGVAFERPAPQLPDMSDADDLFAPRTNNAPKAADIEF